MGPMDMESVLLILLTVISSNAQIILPGDCKENYCYDLDNVKATRQQLGTKTPYPRYTDFDVNREFILPNCNPKKMWLLVRHGARGPTNSEMGKFSRLLYIHDEFLKNYKTTKKRHKCRLCDLDVELLKNWSFKKTLMDIQANQLMPQGHEDLKMLGVNLQKMFPTLFEKDYSERNYLFLFAKEARTRGSYTAFLDGLFGEGASDHIRTRHSKDDSMLLKPYEYCKDSVKNSDVIDEADQEPDKFENTEAFSQVIRDVSFKLGFHAPLNMSFFKQIWDWCGYEQSWFTNKPSPWCAVFSPSHYALLDYREDISYFYKKSYGSKVNLKLTCHTINDMLYHLDNFDTFKVVGYFVHSTLMQLFLTGLGAFRDKENLRADNYHRMHDRQFRSSHILPLSSNLAVVRYECPNEIESDQIMFLLNQKPLNFSWCKGGLCSLSSIKRQYAHFTAMDCNASYCDPTFKGFYGDEDWPMSEANQITGSIIICLPAILLGIYFFRLFL